MITQHLLHQQHAPQLAAARVLIVGVGGLGSPVALYLAAAGVGHLTLADADIVDLSNLQRQIIHATAQIGHAKVLSAQQRLQALNPDIHYHVLQQKLVDSHLSAVIADTDVVVDCSDNFATRFAVNRACVTHGVALVSGAAQQLTGQISVFLPKHSDSPCYACLYAEQAEEAAGTCSETGVIAPLVGVIGSMQALEVLKILLNMGDTLYGRLWQFDAYHARWRQLQFSKDPACPVCGNNMTTPEEN